MQYVANKVDYNSRTEDGTGYFHGMGIIVTITPETIEFVQSMEHQEDEVIPPTSAAARFHSRRVYHHVQQLKGMNLQPQEWRWEQIILQGRATTQFPSSLYE